jgi:uncharacterized protein
MIRFRKIKSNPKRRLPKLAGVFKQNKAINALYLFGSFAAGNVKPLSDVDIAVLLKNGVPASKYWDYKINLFSQASAVLGTDEIDLVLLNEAPPELRYNVLKDGKALFCCNELERREFQEKAVFDYLDTRHLREEGYSQLKERIRKGRFSNDQGEHKKDIASVRRFFGEVGVNSQNAQRRIS